MNRAQRLLGLVVVSVAAGCAGHADVASAVVAPLVATEGAPIVASPASFLYDPNGNGFGGALAVTPDGARLVVASEWDRGADGEPYGAVRVYGRSGSAWFEEAVLRDVVQNNSDRFGMAVAITADSTRIVVGVGQDTTPIGQASGSVRVFVRSGTSYVVEASLTTPDLTSFDLLGSAVAVSANGTRVVATVPGAPGGTAVRSFVRSGSTWTHEGALTVRGTALALSADGTRLLVGMPADGTRGANAGAVRVYLRGSTSWTLETTLLSPDAMTNERFGTAVSLSSDGTRALVGQNLDDVGGVLDVGSADVFLRSGTTWTHEAALRISGASASDEFGVSVTLSGDGTRAVIGSMLDDVGSVLDAGSARLFVRTGGTWAEDAALTGVGGARGEEFARALATDATGAVVFVGVPGDVLSTPSSAEGSVRVYSIALTPIGGVCGGSAACASGFCVDAVCCATACGGASTSDCQACSAALTGGVDGACAALAPSVASTVTCRAVADTCDVAEWCTAASTACPTDAFASLGTACRSRTDLCDCPETCSGAAPSCPVEAGFEPAGTLCRAAAAGTCDAPETCTGSATACPGDGVLSSGSVCRDSRGACDGAERCDGLSFACPGDAFEPAGTLCRARGGACDAEDACTGSSAACPADAVRPVGTLCALGDPAIVCDADDVCDGASPICPATFAPASTVCAPASGEPCDAPDTCAGTSADCVSTYLAGAECRPSLGPCDPEELCGGTSVYCPPDRRTAAGRSCRATTASCDPEEVCDGASATCPSDVSSCEPVPDAGAVVDGGAPSPPDGAAGRPDAGAAPSAVVGCACRAAPHDDGLPALVALLAVVLSATRRRRRVR